MEKVTRLAGGSQQGRCDCGGRREGEGLRVTVKQFLEVIPQLRAESMQLTEVLDNSALHLNIIIKDKHIKVNKKKNISRHIISGAPCKA